MSAVVADLDNSSTPQDTNTNTNAGAGEGGGVETNEGTPESNEQHGSNVVDVAGTSAGGVPVLSPKPVYGKGGVVAEVADDIAAAVDAFTVPTGFVRKGSRVDSFMYSLGVYVEQSAGAKHKYYCLASAECRRGRKEIPCPRGDRSNVNTHLKRKHGMQGTEGAKKDATRKEGQGTIRSALAASANSSLGKNRVRELLCAKMVVDKFLPFSFFSGNSWKDVMGLETADDTPYPALPSRRIKHLLVEMFVATKKLDTREVLPWWRNTGRKMFPYLAPVAQQVLGNQAGAAQVERDFSSCANLLTRNRSRIDTYWVEMVMFLHVNYKRIPAFKDIPMIAAKDIRTCLPPRFNGGDADLAAAEAAFDVIENTNNSDIGV